MPRAAVGTARMTRVYAGRPAQVREVRREVSRFLDGHPARDAALLVISELTTNAVLHSDSRNGFFTVRAEIFPGYLWLEVEDLGGTWTLKPPDDRMHGLGLVAALAAAWQVDGNDLGRVVWARLELTQ